MGRAVLVVDDDQGMRMLVGAQLRTLGFTCDVANDGLAAIEKVRTSQYDAMFVDLMMPRLDGAGFVEAVRAEGCSIPIIVLTSAAPQRIAKLPENAVQAVLQKPVRLIELKAVLSRLLPSVDIPDA